MTKRLLRNPKDFTVALMPFYGTAKSERFGSLLTEHLEIGGELVNALKAENSQKPATQGTAGMKTQTR